MRDLVASLSLLLGLVNTSVLLSNHRDKLLFEKKADLQAKFLSKRELQIFNAGKMAATKVKIEVQRGKEYLVETDLKNNFPIERIEVNGNIKLRVQQSQSQQEALTFKLFWLDKRNWSLD